jgi:mersacidin/lichenicidin family type 2 lantibiotic
MLDTQIIIRAWKNEQFRHELSDTELALLPAHPAGSYDLGDEDLNLTDSPPSYYPSCYPCTYNCD